MDLGRATGARPLAMMFSRSKADIVTTFDADAAGIVETADAEALLSMDLVSARLAEVETGPVVRETSDRVEGWVCPDILPEVTSMADTSGSFTVALRS